MGELFNVRSSKSNQSCCGCRNQAWSCEGSNKGNSNEIYLCVVIQEVAHQVVLSCSSGGGGVHSKAWEEGLAKARQLRKIRWRNRGSKQFLEIVLKKSIAARSDDWRTLITRRREMGWVSCRQSVWFSGFWISHYPTGRTSRGSWLLCCCQARFLYLLGLLLVIDGWSTIYFTSGRSELLLKKTKICA